MASSQAFEAAERHHHQGKPMAPSHGTIIGQKPMVHYLAGTNDHWLAHTSEDLQLSQFIEGLLSQAEVSSCWEEPRKSMASSPDGTSDQRPIIDSLAGTNDDELVHTSEDPKSSQFGHGFVMPSPPVDCGRVMVCHQATWESRVQVEPAHMKLRKSHIGCAAQLPQTHQHDATYQAGASALKPNHKQQKSSYVWQPKREKTAVLSVVGRDVSLTEGACNLMMGRSNLECFLDHTTPALRCQFPPAAKMENSPCNMPRCMPYFNLGELWSSFHEWSAYGAGVPLSLPTKETIIQYYVPYLSAVQIYLRPGCNLFSKHRRVGDESDWSDSGDISSEFSSSDNELDKLLRSQRRLESWDTSSSASSERSSSTEEGSSEHGHQQGDLVFEFFESESPYGRAPLRDKISELAEEFPHLLSLQSNDLSSASWVSVAWYPIYRIPTGPTMRDLATCFLTFHYLWTPPLMLEEETIAGRFEDDFGEKDFVGCHHSSCHVEHNFEGQWPTQLQLPWRIKGEALELPAFGLASYKLRDPFWASAAPADKMRASTLASSADSWLKHLRVQHPDYNFFASRSLSCGRH